jgi:chromosomal replication initiation ATPase DnaA
MTNKYDKMTQQEFDDILADIMDEEIASNLLTIPGIYEIVAEYYNNDVLDKWEEEHGNAI